MRHRFLSRPLGMTKTTQTGMGEYRPKSAVFLVILAMRHFWTNPRHYWARPISPIRPHGVLLLSVRAWCAHVAHIRASPVCVIYQNRLDVLD